MKVLVIAEKNSIARPFVSAFREMNLSATYIKLSRINLVNKKHTTIIKPIGRNLNSFNAVFIQARPTLASFLEPLVDELQAREIYCNAKPNSFYSCNNEAFKLVSLSLCSVPTIRALIVGNSKSLESVSKKIPYPIFVKSVKGNTIQQSILLQNKSELDLFIKSIRSDIDSFIVTESISSELISCLVIGENVIGIKRKFLNGVIVPIEKGINYKLTEEEKNLAISAAKSLSLDIAQVDIAQNKVIDVTPLINFEAFGKISSESIELAIAKHYYSKLVETRGKKSFFEKFFDLDFLFSKTIFSRFFK